MGILLWQLLSMLSGLYEVKTCIFQSQVITKIDQKNMSAQCPSGSVLIPPHLPKFNRATNQVLLQDTPEQRINFHALFVKKPLQT